MKFEIEQGKNGFKQRENELLGVVDSLQTT